MLWQQGILEVIKLVKENSKIEYSDEKIENWVTVDRKTQLLCT